MSQEFPGPGPWASVLSRFLCCPPRHAHKNTVMEVKWNLNGNWLLTASRDHLCKLFDIRNLKEELQVFRGHKKEATGEEGEGRSLLSWSSRWSSCIITCPSVHSCGLASCPRGSVCKWRF